MDDPAVDRALALAEGALWLQAETQTALVVAKAEKALILAELAQRDAAWRAHMEVEMAEIKALLTALLTAHMAQQPAAGKNGNRAAGAHDRQPLLMRGA